MDPDSGPDDVVCFGTTMLVEPQVWFLPGDSIFALGVAVNLPPDFQTTILNTEFRTSVIHAVSVVVVNDAVVPAASSFPRSVMNNSNLASNRMIQQPLGPQQLVDQMPINKQLPSRANVNYFLSRRQNGSQQQCKE